MRWLRVVRARLFGLLHKRRLEAEMEEELRFHLAMRMRENLGRGMSESDAAQQARRQLGNLTLIKDEWRDVSGGGWLETFSRDLRFAARILAKERALTFASIVALALGIGANTALYTVMRSVLLRPLPYPQPNELVAVWSSDSRDRDTHYKVSYPDFVDLQARNHTLQSLGAFLAGSFLVNNNGGASAQVQGAFVTPEIFQMLDAKPALGRIFHRADNEPGNRAVIISDKLWEERFARAANVTGAKLMAEGEEYTVIGVMPRGFRFPVQNIEAQLWVTFGRDREPYPNGAPSYTTRRDGHYLRLLGRLKSASTSADAAADLNAIAADLATIHPDSNLHFDAAAVTPLLADLTKKVRPALVMLLAAAGCLLCVGCANIANLLLARGSTRQKEIALRGALGAGRGRIFRQLLTESLLLALAGGTAGLLLALGGTRLLVALLPPDFPRAVEIAPDARVLGFAAIVTLVTSCIFGFAPAWRSARSNLAPVLNDSSGAATETRQNRRLRNGLIVAEMVLSLVLLTCACCLIENVARLRRAPLGFNPQHLMTAKLTLPNQPDGQEWTRVINFSTELLKRVRQLPGATSASAIWPLPAVGAEPVADFGFAGTDIPKGDWPRSHSRVVLPNYFTTMEIPIKSGRDFDQRDTRHAKPVAIISDTLARKFFPNEDPIGRRIIPGLDDGRGILEREIIGVVGDVTSDRSSGEQMPEIYVPYSQCISLELSLLIRSEEEDGASLISSARQIAEELNSEVPFYGVSSMDEHLDLVLAQPRLNSALLAVFAAVAVVLTAIGVYGVMAYSVAQRRHEIGIRLALGARRSAIMQLVLGEGARLIAWSIVVGTVLTLCVLPRLGSLAPYSFGSALYTTSLVAGVVGAAALAACWLPARRAARANPLAAIGSR